MANSFYLPKSAVEGNELFANIKILASERVERQTNEKLYTWNLRHFQERDEKAVRDDLEKLIRSDLVHKLMAFDYRRALEGFGQIEKITKDPSYQSHIR